MLFVLSRNDLERNPDKYTMFHQIHQIRIHSFLKGIPAPVFHLCPSGFGQSKAAWIGHISHTVNILHRFSP